MSEGFKIFLTSALTIFGGIVVIVVGQIATKFFIEPLHEHRKIIGEIAESLIFYADLYTNPGVGERQAMDQAKRVLRQEAAQLMATSYAIQCRKVARLLRISMPEPSDITEARKSLIGLSNSIHQGDPKQNLEWVEEIRKRLRIEIATSSAAG